MMEREEEGMGVFPGGAVPALAPHSAQLNQLPDGFSISSFLPHLSSCGGHVKGKIGTRGWNFTMHALASESLG